MAFTNAEAHLLPAEILRQGDVVRRVLATEPVIGEVAADLARGGISEIVMTGCGDSLFAAMASQFAFVSFSRRLPHAVHALEYSRALYRASSSETLLCALSYGGETKRTLEAVTAARHVGAKILAISVDAHGPIPQMAHYFVPNVGDERSNCRTGSFQAAYLELVLLAGHLAAFQGGADVLAGLRAELAALARGLDEFVQQTEAPDRMAALLADAGQIYYLGGGEAHAAALYGAAKLYETSSLPAVPQETEQFAHCEIFSLEPDSVVVATALRGPFYTRTVEVVEAIRALGARTVGISDEAAFASHVDEFTQIPFVPPGRLMASMAVVPMQWMAYFHAARRGSNPDLVRHKAVNSPLIRECQIWTPEDYTLAEDETARSRRKQ